MNEKDATNSKTSLSRHEVKKKLKDKRDRDELVQVVNNFFRSLLADPGKWSGDGLGYIQHAIQKIANEPETYPPFHIPNELSPTNNNDNNIAITEGLAEALSSHQPMPVLPVLHITGISSVNRATIIQGSNYHIRQWRIIGYDGNTKPINIRLDSILNSKGVLLTEGVIVRLDKFVPVYFNLQDNNPNPLCVLLVKAFSIIGNRPVPEELLGEPHNLLPIQPMPHPILPTLTDNSCNGRPCSIHGIMFIQCITRCFPVPDVDINGVLRECVFVTTPSVRLAQKEKRFLLYYWYATSVYQFRGKNNRITLPVCLVLAIRKRFPEPNGIYATEIQD